MPRVQDIWERDGERCVWCSTASWPRDRTLEHLLPRSRGGRSGEHNLLPACRSCNKGRRSQGAAAYARRQAEGGHTVDVDLLLTGLDRLAAHGTPAERDYGARQASRVRAWVASERALAEHLARFAA
jgi:hypothetical protein